MSARVYLPKALPELFRILGDNPQARIFAGGTDLLVKSRPDRDGVPPLVCLERIAELRGIDTRRDMIRLGAATAIAEIEKNTLTRKHLPILVKAARELGSPLIRTMATLGGNLCTASPAGDTLPPLYALGAQVELQSEHGTRTLPIADFILGPGKTALGPGEIATAVLAPKSGAFDVHHFEKVGRRAALAIAVVSLALLARIGPRGRIESVRIALGSVGPTVMTCPETSCFLTGKRLSLPNLRRAATLIREEIAPITDLRASAAYRRDVAGNLLLRLSVA